jgi:hypothetical protein
MKQYKYSNADGAGANQAMVQSKPRTDNGRGISSTGVGISEKIDKAVPVEYITIGRTSESGGNSEIVQPHL